MLRNARTFRRDGASEERRVWRSADDRYEFHTHRLKSEFAEWFLETGLCEPARGDVVCLYRKRGRAAGWLQESYGVLARNALDEYGALATATRAELLGMGRAAHPEQPERAAALFQLCVPSVLERDLGFTVQWADAFVGGSRSRSQLEARAQDFAGETKGYGSSVVGACVIRLNRAPDPQRFWSGMFRIYGDEVFGMPEFGAFANEHGAAEIAQSFVERPPAAVEKEPEEEEDFEWPENFELDVDDQGVIRVRSASTEPKRVGMRTVERELLTLDSTGAAFVDFVEKWRAHNRLSS